MISNHTNVSITDYFLSDSINLLNVSKLNRRWSNIRSCWIWILESTHKHVSLSAVMAAAGYPQQSFPSCTHTSGSSRQTPCLMPVSECGTAVERMREATSLHILLSPPPRLNQASNGGFCKQTYSSERKIRSQTEARHIHSTG